jgi:hypothetical protein
MKRAAIIISGELRSIHNMENIVENIILPNDNYIFDIFISSWNRQTYMENGNILEKETDYSLLEKYNPIKIQLNDRKNFEKIYHENNLGSLTTYSNSCHFYTCETGMKEVEQYELAQNMKYDLYIKHRFDLFLTRPILFNEYHLDKIHGINFSGGCSFGTYWNDWFFFGDEKMKDFMKIFTKLCDGKLNTNNKFCLCGEILFEKSGENNIVYDINHQLVYLNKYGITHFL